MKAVILAGGKGTRLRPYTKIFPKPLVPIDDKPVLEIIINQLIKNGFNEIIMAVGHLAELIRAFFGDGSKFGVNIKELPLKQISIVHDYAGLIMGSLVLVHLILHWKWIVVMTKNLFKREEKSKK